MLYMTTPVIAGGLGDGRFGRDIDLRHVYGFGMGRLDCRRASSATAGSGSIRSVLIGGVVIMLGHFALVFPPLPFFYAGLALDRHRHGAAEAERQHARRVALSAGRLRRDNGFSIFYMGINVGALLGPLVAGYLAQRVNWHIGFASAGVGMAIGLIQLAIRTAPSQGGRRTAGAPAWRSRAAPRATRPGDPARGRRTDHHGRRMEAPGRHRRLLSLRHPVLRRVRAGRIHAEPLHRSLHAPRGVRLRHSRHRGSSRCSRSS